MTVGYVVRMAFKIKTIEESSEQPFVSKMNSSSFILEILTISFLCVTHIKTNLSKTGKTFSIVV